ncbi:MAG: dipeptide epimerase [Chlorobiaceae bacterium]|nr:dipeptide epimerase [Chlorobiaceae bacterium]MBA4309603.1 dipeptide epimerase [Chlorobiaceae bacterium]
MGQDRRDFLKLSTLATGALLFSGTNNNLFANNIRTNMKSSKLKLKFYPYTLQLKHVFTLAKSSRTTTPVVLTELEYDGIIGYGEASMPPYLGESQESAQAFLAKLDMEQFTNPMEIDKIISYVDSVTMGNTAAKASVDIALHDLVGKILGHPLYKIWGLEKSKTPYTSFTIGIDKPDVVRQKVKEAEEFKVLKIKLGRDTDKEMIETIRSVTDKPLTADANQGWKDKHLALDMIEYLKENGALYIEQPMDKNNLDDHAWLSERSPIPVLADEACQRLVDIPKIYQAYNGINIKLMKCTGVKESYKMIILARALNLKVMLGCMTETSCAISAASHLSPLVDWADLDGALLINNDIFDGTKIIDGKVVLSDKPGFGLTKI